MLLKYFYFFIFANVFSIRLSQILWVASVNFKCCICQMSYKLQLPKNSEFKKFNCIPYMKKIIKELSFCHKLWFYNPYIFATLWCKLWYYKLRQLDLTEFFCLKYQRSTTSGCKDIWIKKWEFVAKTQFLWR